MGTWEAVESGVSKAAKFQSWPNPVNWIVDIHVLMCNQDTWLAELEFAAATAFTVFWTQFIPSPREIERKILMGSYKCGFFIDEGFRSPLEVIWGKDTQRVLVEIARPFVTGLFYIWVASATIDALAAWQTIMWPELFCDPFRGDYKYSGAHASASGLHSEGSVGLGHLDYDPNHYGNDFVADMNVPAGWTTMNAYWVFDATGGAMTNIKTGWLIGGTQYEVQNHGNMAAGEIKHITRQLDYTHNDSGHDFAPFWAADTNGLGAPRSISAVRVIGDHKNSRDETIPKLERPVNRHRPRPRCAIDTV